MKGEPTDRCQILTRVVSGRVETLVGSLEMRSLTVPLVGQKVSPRP
jgi:hypothetical protein